MRFPRLRALLDPIAPGGPQGSEPVAMSLGEPRHPLPPFLAEELARHHAGYSKYPPNEGDPGLRDAIAAWANRRYDLGDLIDPAHNVFPLNGTREGLFYSCVALSPEQKNGEKARRSAAEPILPVLRGRRTDIGRRAGLCECFG